jgi:hypothetical protein
MHRVPRRTGGVAVNAQQEKAFWEATREYAKANTAIAIEREQLLADPNRDPDIRQGRYAEQAKVAP